jgi:hypothetical protein
VAALEILWYMDNNVVEPSTSRIGFKTVVERFTLDPGFTAKNDPKSTTFLKLERVIMKLACAEPGPERSSQNSTQFWSFNTVREASHHITSQNAWIILRPSVAKSGRGMSKSGDLE